MKREKWLSIIAAICLGISTVGFLLLPQIFDGNIKSKREENVSLISSQQSTFDMLVKANSYIEFVKLIEAEQDILKILNAPNDILQKYKNNRLEFYKSSVHYAINAIPSEKLVESQKDKKREEINKLTLDELDKLNDTRLKYMEIAAESTYDLGKRIDDNKINILNLEKSKNRWFYICFFFQTWGLIFGLFAIVSVKAE